MTAKASKTEIQISILADPHNPQAVIRCTWSKSFDYPRALATLIKSFFLLNVFTTSIFQVPWPVGDEHHNLAHLAAVFAVVARLFFNDRELKGSKLGHVFAGEVMIVAVLHGAGYISKEGDISGPGAQDTKNHM